ncbi:MAG: NAD-dependent epimerase/dehydratase family protein [Candidatus Eremiobacteraeota bacterium]|nr:NAD-dependent epimerase/dehydratase family protein [Candidatus Eremiobacteraeota bacterium]MBV9647194.1 NAD-dependent epimerase/dehydratase family protein [Candidatus Eremiobacteraeota bacterium]
MNVLVLGGTVFLGRALVASLNERGHAVTTFTRGVHSFDDVPAANRILGDRDGDLSLLPADGWDAVIDTSGYRPAIVRKSCDHLRGANCYAFVSTISVYDETQLELREDSPLKALSADVDETSPEAYGPLKAQCEQVVQETFGARGLVVRPGLIVGPHDPTDRFTYWPERADRGGVILAPSPPQRCVQFIDVRDVADFLVRAIERGTRGPFNVTGRPRATTMSNVVDACRRSARHDSEVVWVDEEFLVLHGVGPWVELPLWIPSSAGLPGFTNASVASALSHGLAFRALDVTVRDTLEWARRRDPDEVRKAGLSAERESTLLEAWRSAHSDRAPSSAG